MFSRVKNDVAPIIRGVFFLGGLVGGIALAVNPDEEAARAASQELKAFYSSGDFEKAGAAAERYTAAIEKAFGGGSSLAADGYAIQAKVYARAGNAPKTRDARAAALRILSTTHGRESEPDSASLLALAMASSDLEEFDIAADLAIRAATILQDGGYKCDPIVPDLLAYLAVKAWDAGRSWQEERCLEQLALWAATQAFGEESSERLERLRAIALFYAEMQRYPEAAAMWEAAIAIHEKRPETPDRDLIECREAAASCWELISDYARAESTARRAVEQAQTNPRRNIPKYKELLRILARACAHQGKWEEAESVAKQVLAIVEANRGSHSEEANETRQTLALVYALQEQWGDAEDLIRQSLAASSGVKGRKKDMLHLTSALASLLWNAGKHDEAEQMFVQAIAVAEKEWGADGNSVALIKSNLAANYFYQGRYEEAEAITRQSLETLRNALGEQHPRVAMMHINLATVEAAQGRWAEAAEDNDKGCRLQAQHIRGQLAVLPPVEQLRLLRGQYAIGYQAALTMGMLQRSTPRIRELSAGWLTNGKAIAHEASSRQSQMAVQAVANGRDIAAVQWIDIDTVRAQIPPTAVLIDIARFDVFNYAARRKGEDWNPARYAAWIVPPQGKGEVQVVDLGDASAIDTAVAAYRDTLRAASNAKGSTTNGSEAKAEQVLRESAKPLVDKVLQPMMAGVRAAGCEESAQELIISPDGELWLLPWGALPLEDGRYLVGKYATATVTSGRDLLPSNDNVKALESLVFANPSFDLPAAELVKAVRAIDVLDESPTTPVEASIAASGSRHRSITELGRAELLPASVGEARRVTEGIENLTGEKPRVFLQDRALEERVKRARSPRILHFATHGFVLPDQLASVARIEQQSKLSTAGKPIQGLTSEAGEPLEDPLLRCGLLLAGGNSSGTDRPEGVDDGCLTGKEIVALDLRGTKLVVLSACETGLGRVQYGEGVAGLRQAFLIAGAEAVLASLWQVTDSDAAALVSRFFAKLADGQENAFALREAQLAMIEKRRKGTGAAHPAAWAGFQITGR